MRLWLFILGIVATCQVYAVGDIHSKVKSAVHKVSPRIKIDHIEPSPVKGLYKVTAGMEIFYVTKDGNYFFYGDLLNLQMDRKNWNITEQAQKTARVSAIASLPAKDFIEFTPTVPVKGTITVFTDLDCGYCHKFHEEINQMLQLGIKVRYIAFPRAGEKSAGYDKAVSVWCAKDRQAAYSLVMTGKEVIAQDCDARSIVTQHYKFGLDFGIRGTPTIVLEDGTVIPGYAPAEELYQIVLDNKAGA